MKTSWKRLEIAFAAQVAEEGEFETARALLAEADDEDGRSTGTRGASLRDRTPPLAPTIPQDRKRYAS